MLGSVGVGRAATGAFREQEIELLKTFAAPPVIATENLRLFNELETLYPRRPSRLFARSNLTQLVPPESLSGPVALESRLVATQPIKI